MNVFECEERRGELKGPRSENENKSYYYTVYKIEAREERHINDEYAWIGNHF